MGPGAGARAAAEHMRVKGNRSKSLLPIIMRNSAAVRGTRLERGV